METDSDNYHKKKPDGRFVIDNTKDSAGVVFKAILPSTRALDFGDLPWLSPDGNRAVLIDLVSGSFDPAVVPSQLLELLNNSACELSAQSLLLELHKLLQRIGGQAVAAVVDWKSEVFECVWVGNPRLYAISRKNIISLLGRPQIHPMNTLGMSGNVSINHKHLRYFAESVYWLTSDGIEPAEINKHHQAAYEADTELNWRRIGDACATGDDWSIITFPVQLRSDFRRENWPYDPFVGAQEERQHEKKGLALLADALFGHPDFHGFKIVGSGPIGRKNSTRLVDGYLVSPWGVVLLELKDHRAEVQLPLSAKRAPMRVHGQVAWRDESNPINKVSEALRPFSKWNLGASIDGKLRNIGAVIFTNHHAQVSCITPEGHVVGIPQQYGNVLVGTAYTLADQLRAFARETVGKSAVAAISAQQIDEIVEALRGAVQGADITHESTRYVDGYSMGSMQIAEESTSYYQIFPGESMAKGTPVWIKRFPISALNTDSLERAASNLGREADALRELMLSDLSPRVQRYLGGERNEEEVFVVLEHVNGLRLDEWLSTKPERARRIGVIKNLAKTLTALANANIVHRALSPSNVRIQKNDVPVVINFELCRLEHLATLPISGRRALDRRFVAPETNQVGMPVTPASDTYSFGRLATLILTDALQFETYEEQRIATSAKGFWEKLASDAGVPATDLRLLLTENPMRRPVGGALMEMVERWE